MPSVQKCSLIVENNNQRPGTANEKQKGSVLQYSDCSTFSLWHAMFQTSYDPFFHLKKGQKHNQNTEKRVTYRMKHPKHV